MIYGINPYTISSIRAFGFKRWGTHPSWSKVMRKRNPIRGFLGFYESGLLDGIIPPYVAIYGSNGAMLRQITCHSNDRAEQLREQLQEQLETWLHAQKCQR
jgi:hypothetical protein